MTVAVSKSLSSPGLLGQVEELQTLFDLFELGVVGEVLSGSRPLILVPTGPLSDTHRDSDHSTGPVGERESGLTGGHGHGPGHGIFILMGLDR